MATCPECKASSRTTPGFTVEEIMEPVARGDALEAQLAVGEVECRSAYRLTCPCGWFVVGDISEDGTHLVVRQ